jgi:undecaprenyl-phosphate galactose phosphotransferase/putative colanic acid biosynthesis UDP-glucose lipid carrier transferase
MTYVGSSTASSIGLRHAPQQLFTYGNVGLIAGILDCVFIVVASLAAGIGYHLATFGTFGDVRAFAGVGINTALLFVLLARSKGMYRPTALLHALEWRKVVGSWVAVLLAFVALLFLLKLGESYSRGATIIFSLLGLGLLLGSRAVIANSLHGALAGGKIAGKRAVIIGEREELDQRSTLDLRKKYAIREVGRFELPPRDPDIAAATDQSHAILSAAVDAARSKQAEMVLLAIGWTDKVQYDLVCQHLRALALPAVLLPDKSVRSILAQPMAEMGTDIAVQVQRAPLGTFETAVKRTIDLVGASVALLLLWPLLLMIAAAVRLTSRGPVLFLEDRIGFNGQTFKIYRFRRVTPLAGFMRASGIDELPQLLNVLRGEMSLVGPRPHAVDDDGQYSPQIADYASRQRVKPGITGWAQVNGYHGETQQVEQMARRVDFDLWYINNWSIWLDLRILSRICLQVFRSDAAH